MGASLVRFLKPNPMIEVMLGVVVVEKEEPRVSNVVVVLLTSSYLVRLSRSSSCQGK